MTVWFPSHCNLQTENKPAMLYPTYTNQYTYTNPTYIESSKYCNTYSIKQCGMTLPRLKCAKITNKGQSMRRHGDISQTGIPFFIRNTKHDNQGPRRKRMIVEATLRIDTLKVYLPHILQRFGTTKCLCQSFKNTIIHFRIPRPPHITTLSAKFKNCLA